MLTVGQLKKALKGIKDSTPVYIRDHDHAEYETNSPAIIAKKINQEEADPWDNIREEFIIKGDYFIVSA